MAHDGRLERPTLTDRDHIEHLDHAGEDAVDTQDVSVQDAQEKRGTQRQFGKLTPSQAASLRWERERARAKDAEEQAAYEARGVALIVRTTVPVGKIIEKLSVQAQRGDVAAARELRAYLAEAQVETETDLSSLDRRTLQALKARLLAEIETEAIEQPDVPDGLDETTA